MKSLFLKTINLKWLQHLVFWMLSVYVIASYFAISNELETIDFIYSVLFHGCLWSIVYLNLKLAIPLLWSKDKFLLFVISMMVLIIVGLGIHKVLFDLLGPYFIDEYFFVSFTQTAVLIRIFGIYLVLSTLLHLSGSWFSLQQAQREKSVLELASLKSQLNPHFLFNGLNSIYSLSLKNDPKAPAAILKLSELLRYALHETSKDLIPLEKEIEMIENYLDIQKTRLQQPEILTFQRKYTGTDAIEIPPMLMLPLVENAFKHGDNHQNITLNLHKKKRSICFTISNTVDAKSYTNEESSGIGLANIRKRLALLYPNKHHLTVKESQGKFNVQLEINFS